jgi:hypothetical protein
MSGNEVGSIEYMRSLVDSDSAIAIQCRADLVAKCNALADLIDNLASLTTIKAADKSVDRAATLALMVEQRLYNLCNVAFEIHDIDFDMSVIFPDLEAIVLLTCRFKEIVRRPSSGSERFLAESRSAYVALSSLKLIERWSDRTFQQAASAPVNAYEDEDDSKFFDALMADKTLTWPDRTLHPSYSPKVLAEKLAEMDETLLSAIADEQEILDAKKGRRDRGVYRRHNLMRCKLIVRHRVSAIQYTLDMFEEGAIAE